MEQSKKISHKGNIKIRRHYLDINNNNIYESFILEQCHICGKDMDNIRNIWVDIESDLYVCEACKNKYNVQSVKKCKELN